MSERYKRCESCGSEFQLRVEACLDCGGPLEEIDPRMITPPRGPDRDDEEVSDLLTGVALAALSHLVGLPPFLRLFLRREESAPRTAPARVLTAADRPFALRVAQPDDIEPLAERLRAAGLRCEVVPEGDCRSGCKIRWAVWVAEADRAAASAIERQHLASLVPDADRFVDLEGDGCPACGAPRLAGTVECGECGLALDFAPEDPDELAVDGPYPGERQEKVAL